MGKHFYVFYPKKPHHRKEDKMLVKGDDKKQLNGVDISTFL